MSQTSLGSLRRPFDTQPAVLRYRRRALRADLWRGIGGVALTLFLAWNALQGGVMIGFFLILLPTLVFGLYLLRTLLRYRRRFHVDAEGFAVNQQRLRWADLTGLVLRFYSSPRQRRQTDQGFMDATLIFGRRRVRLDSTLLGFEPLVEHAAAVAVAKGVPLDEFTAHNLLGMGLRLPVAADDLQRFRLG